jgi:SAM-dependent methyltransferase
MRLDAPPEPHACEGIFLLNTGCPLCARPPGEALAEVRYHETAEVNLNLPDVHGTLFRCEECGIAFPSHQYAPTAFPLLYSKSLGDHEYFDQTMLQKMRVAYMRAILRKRHQSWSWSQFLDHLSLHVLQVPLLAREPRGLRVLDVGCGLGEFTSILQDLGNEVVGTEIVPSLVERNLRRGLDCRFGELESLTLPASSFDLILMRAVFYRTRQPSHALEIAKRALAPHGEISLVDPCVDRAGAEYFFRKQFPQGQLYVLDHERYFAGLEKRFGLKPVSARRIYGRPSAPLHKVRWWGNVRGLAELFLANLLHRKPYVMAYNLRNTATAAAKLAA